LWAEQTGRTFKQAIWYRVFLLEITKGFLNTQSLISSDFFKILN